MNQSIGSSEWLKWLILFIIILVSWLGPEKVSESRFISLGLFVILMFLFLIESVDNVVNKLDEILAQLKNMDR